jgi:endonuclease YncB( thermonuclease family)
MASLATAALAARLATGGVTLSDVGRDKYGGRVVARVRDAGGRDVAAALAAAGLVRPYAGRRPDWCS